MECDKCHITFTLKKNLQRHQKYSCKVMINAMIDELEILKNKYNALKEQYETIVAEHNQQIGNLQKEHDQTQRQVEQEYKQEIAILREELAYKSGEQKHLKEQTQRYEQHLFKENSKPRITINNVAPYNMTPELATKICEKYTVDHFLQGPECTYRYMLDNHLTDTETGKKLLVCTDIARSIFKGIDTNGVEFTDVGAERVLSDVVRPLKIAINKAGNDLYDIKDDDFIQGKRKSHYRILEPRRLKKKLSGDLH